MILFEFAAYIYIRGEFYNEASNMQVAINEVLFACFFVLLANSIQIQFLANSNKICATK